MTFIFLSGHSFKALWNNKVLGLQLYKCWNCNLFNYVVVWTNVTNTLPEKWLDKAYLVFILGKEKINEVEFMVFNTVLNTVKSIWNQSTQSDVIQLILLLLSILLFHWIIFAIFHFMKPIIPLILCEWL